MAAGAHGLHDDVGERLASLEGVAPDERGREGIRAYVRTMAAHPEFFRFIVGQGNRSDARQRWLIDTHVEPGVQLMKQLGLLRLIGAGEDELPHALFAMLVSCFGKKYAK